MCLARLLYHDKEIIILDEATNALDKKSEKAVIQLIRSLKNKTIIMISHDYENLKFCDKLFKVNEKGSTIKFLNKMKYKILDCTLRDGGYYNNWLFSKKLAQDYLYAMSKSGIK